MQGTKNQQKVKCEVCHEKDSRFNCSRCSHSFYCSKDCQREAWPAHKKLCQKQDGYKKYKWDPPSMLNSTVWDVKDMLTGPDQPMDPPESFEHLENFWMDHNFLVAGVSRFQGSYIPPEAKALIQEGLRAKRLTWEFMDTNNFFVYLTSALLPPFYLPTIIQTLIDQDIKQNAVSLMKVHIEHWWRVHGLDSGSREYDPEVGAVLRKHRITLPFTIEGHHNDEFRALTHLRKSKPGHCRCYNCLVALHKTELDRDVWEAMRVGEAKRGRYIVSWDQYQELEAKRLENERRIASGLAPLPPPTFIDNMTRPIKVPKPDDITFCMNMFKYANEEKRPIKTDELEEIVNALVVPLSTFTKENVRRQSLSSVAADPISKSMPANKALTSASTILSEHRFCVATEDADEECGERNRNCDEGDEGDDCADGHSVDAEMATMKLQETPTGAISRPKRKAALGIKCYNMDLHSEDGDNQCDLEKTARGLKGKSTGESGGNACKDKSGDSEGNDSESMQSDDTSNYSLDSGKSESVDEEDDEDSDLDSDDEEQAELQVQSKPKKSRAGNNTVKRSGTKAGKTASSSTQSAPAQTHDWSIQYAALTEYGRQHGHCNVPQKAWYECVLRGLGENGSDYMYSGNLGTWLNQQRCMKKGTCGNRHLSVERERQLQSLVDQGKLAWELPGISDIAKAQGEIDWPRNYAALIEYGRQHGHCNVPQKAQYECVLRGLGENGSDYMYSGNLGSWLHDQRCMKNGTKGNKRLTVERERQLQSLVDQGLLHW